MKKMSMKRLWPSLKLGLVVFGVQIIMSLFALALSGMIETHLALRIFLSVLFLLGVIVLVFVYTKNVAYDQYNRMMNNRARVRNGETLDDSMLGKEYHWYKGYLIGAGICVPLLVFTVIGFLTDLPTLQLVSFLLYGCYLFPIYLPIGVYHVSLNLVGCAIEVMLVGVTYHIQGIKMETGLATKVDSRVKGKYSEIGAEPKKKKKR